jgi:hypothetical protein
VREMHLDERPRAQRVTSTAWQPVLTLPECRPDRHAVCGIPAVQSRCAVPQACGAGA